MDEPGITTRTKVNSWQRRLSGCSLRFREGLAGRSRWKHPLSLTAWFPNAFQHHDV